MSSCTMETVILHLQANDISCTSEEVRAAFFSTDKDQSGDLDLDEFGQFCANTTTVFVRVEKEKKNSDKPSKR